MTTIHALTIVALCGLTACRGPARPEAQELKECEAPTPPACPRPSCGGNSPVINTFPVNGLRPDGECNHEGAQLMPESLTGGTDNSCNGSTLDIRDGELIGLAPNGRIACKGNELRGASFVVRGWRPETRGSAKDSLTVRIAEIQPAYSAGVASETRMAYRMVAGDGASLCTAAGARAARKTLGLDVIAVSFTDPGPDKDFVIPVSGELYNILGQPFEVEPNWARQQAEWLQLACVDDALAKRSLYDLHTDNVATNRAALMMFVANYCGHLHDTWRGVQIAWELFDDKVEGPGKHDPTTLEAKWGPTGAVCVSSPRAAFDGPKAMVPSEMYGDLEAVAKACPNCTTADAWAEALRGCLPPLKKTPPPPPRKMCKDCEGPECKGRRLHSYVLDQGAK